MITQARTHTHIFTVFALLPVAHIKLYSELAIQAGHVKRSSGKCIVRVELQRWMVGRTDGCTDVLYWSFSVNVLDNNGAFDVPTRESTIISECNSPYFLFVLLIFLYVPLNKEHTRLVLQRLAEIKAGLMSKYDH